MPQPWPPLPSWLHPKHTATPGRRSSHPAPTMAKRHGSASWISCKPAGEGPGGFYPSKSSAKRALHLMQGLRLSGKGLLCPAQGATECLRTLQVWSSVQEVAETRAVNLICTQFCSAPITRLRKAVHSGLLSRQQTPRRVKQFASLQPSAPSRTLMHLKTSIHKPEPLSSRFRASTAIQVNLGQMLTHNRAATD